MTSRMRNLTIALVTAFVLLGALAVSPAAAQAPRTLIDWLLVDRITVLRGNVDVVSGNVTLDSGDMTVGASMNTTAQSAIAVTDNSTVTPTGTYQPLTADGAVGTSSIAAGADGDLLVLINESSNTITFTDTGTLKLSSNAALGEFDSLTLISDSTNWVEIARSDN